MEQEFYENFSDDYDNEDYEEPEIKVSSDEIDINEFYKTYAENKKNFKTSPILRNMKKQE